MAEISWYQQNELPEHIKWQILSFLRVEWPEGFQGKNHLRDWISPEKYHPISFVSMEKDILISHCEVLWKYLTYNEVIYKVYGLSGVFTYPSFRGEGFGLEVVMRAKQYIEKQDGDSIFFNSVVQGFYERAGFLRMHHVRTTYGDVQQLLLSEETAFMLFLTEKGKVGKQSFESLPVYFGENTW